MNANSDNADESGNKRKLNKNESSLILLLLLSEEDILK
jgi:hypothetical protein